MENSGLVLYPEDARLTTYPIFRPNLWDFYEKAQRSYWVPSEVSLSRDVSDFEKLTTNEQHFIKQILAFFASSDGIVNINLAERFSREIPILEAQYFYNYQMMMENIHAQMYSILIDTLITDQTEKKKMFADALRYPVIDKMANYMFDTIRADTPLNVRLLRMAAVEGIFFSGCFCAIYWLQSKGRLPGLAHSNELISRDEALHTLFAIELYKMMSSAPLPTIHQIFMDATEIAIEFIKESIPVGLEEMNSDLMSEYIRTQTDNILTLIHEDPIYNSKNPFAFMEQINLHNHTDFFSRRVSEYSKSSSAETTVFEINYDF